MKICNSIVFIVALCMAMHLSAQEPAHPSLLFTQADLPAITSKVESGWIKNAFDVMKDQADEFLSIPTDPYPFSTSQTGYATAGRGLNARINALALTGIILSEQTYIDKAIAILTAACEQASVDDFDGFNGHLAVGDAAHAYAVGYDWLYGYLTQQQRDLVSAEIAEFGQWLYDYSIAGGYGVYKPTPLSCNHNSVVHGALGLCALALGDKNDWLERAVTYTLGYFTYSRDDTGYNYEGIGYYGYGALGAITFSAAYNKAGLGDLVGQVSKNEYVPEYVLRKIVPWGGKVIALNDSPSRLDAASGLMYKAVKYQDRTGLWGWLKLMGSEGDGYYGINPSGYIGGGCSLPYIIIYADPDLVPLSPKDADKELYKFFARGTGTFRSSWDDDAAMAVFTCGFDQHRGHNHRDENTFSFCGYGEQFAIDPPSSLWETKSHNGILVNNTGQNREEDQYDVYGQTVDTKNFGTAWYIKGEAVDAYPDALNIDKAVRQFMFVKAEKSYIVIADDIQKQGGAIADYSWLLNTATTNSFEIESNSQFKINTPSGAVARVKFCNPQGISLVEANLEGQSIEVRGSILYYNKYYKQIQASYYGSNPRFVAVITAASDEQQLPDVTYTGDVDNMVIKVEFEEGVYDAVTVTREAMDFERVNVDTVADINKDGSVDGLDFTWVAKQWLDCSDPTNSNCKRYN